jgi:CDP-paratose 2-epimerase
MFWHYHLNPVPGAVYNAGGGRDNSISILEAIDSFNKILNEKLGTNEWNDYTILDENRIGDHIWWISDMSKFKSEYPDWDISKNSYNIIDETIEAYLKSK